MCRRIKFSASADQRFPVALHTSRRPDSEKNILPLPLVNRTVDFFFFFSFGLRSGAMTHHVRFRHFTWRQQSLARCGFFVIFHLGINIELGSQVLVRCNFEYKFDSSLSDFVWIAIGSIRFLSVGGHTTPYQHEIQFFRR